jgi:hypothetical protein
MTTDTIKVGEYILEVTNPRNIQPVSGDVYTECRQLNGIASISFAAISTDGDGKPKAEITARLRLSLPLVADLHQHFEKLLREAGAVQQTTH